MSAIVGRRGQSRQSLVPIETVVGMLADRIEALCHALFPNGTKAGREPEFRVGDLAGTPSRHGRGMGSLSIRLIEPRAGVWKDFATGECGDALDLIAQAVCGGDKRRAVRWAMVWLGLADADAETLQRIRRAPPPERAEAPEEESATRGRAQMLYLKAEEQIVGTPVDGYLAGRGLDLRKLPFPVRSLRYHPRLWNVESRRHWPAMVAAVVGGDGKFLSIHRTWLDVRAAGVTKAPLAEPKKTYGPYAGGVIRLWRGITIDGETGEIKQARRLAEVKAPVWVDLVEGIEDGLTVAIAAQEARVLSGVSLGNMLALDFGPTVEGVYFWRQNDEPGSPAAKTSDKIVAALQAQGKRVRIPRPPWGVKDVNDFAREEFAS